MFVSPVPSFFLLRLWVARQKSHAAGFDKLVIWSGHYAGLGNTATSLVEGPQSPYFNPSHLADAEGTRLSLNFSPAFPEFDAPVAAPIKLFPQNASSYPSAPSSRLWSRRRIARSMHSSPLAPPT